MTVTVRYRDKKQEVPAGTRVGEAVRQMGLGLEGIIARVDGRLVTEDYVLKDGDTLEIISAISGG